MPGMKVVAEAIQFDKIDGGLARFQMLYQSIRAGQVFALARAEIAVTDGKTPAARQVSRCPSSPG